MTDYVKMALLQPVSSEGTVCDHHSPEQDARTRQSQRDESDINLTIKKYNLQPSDFSRLVAGWSGRQLGEYGDASAVPTFMEMLDIVNRAKDAFMEFPPEVRAFFGNNPAAMLDAWQQGQYPEVFEDLGILERAPDEAALAAAARAERVAEFAEGVRAGTIERNADGTFK